jgi:PKD repeat protein
MLALAALFGMLTFLWLLGGQTAQAAAGPTVTPYGEVSRFPSPPGPDTKAKFGAATTESSSLTAGKFVDPVAMAVDPSDANAPDEYGIYVLDNVNPQALNGFTASTLTSLKLEYRIQKLGEHGEVLGSVMFALQSSVAEPGLHATSLAVDGADHRVYVMIMDTPPVSGNTEHNAVDRIVAWTAGDKKGEAPLAPAVGLLGEDDLPQDSLTGAGELAGPTRPNTLQTGAAELKGDVDGESIAIEGTGANADLALAGNEYSSLEATVPFIERLVTTGANAGKLDSTHATWEDAAATEDEAAQKWEQKSSALYSLSASPDGSLNVSLGFPEPHEGFADQEPNMAKVSSQLRSTQPVLPWSNAIEGEAAFAPNRDRAATVGFGQDGRHSGALAPSVVELGGNGFPGGVYAGVVANFDESDSQNPLGVNFSWRFAAGKEENGVRSLESPASPAIRVFDAQGHSLALIGNLTAGGPCNIQGGPVPNLASYTYGSFVALAPGRGGTFFALVQASLTGTTGSVEEIAPGSPIGAGMGDQVLEFAPGAGQNGAAGQECPQPSGGFAITDETQHGAPSKGTGPVTVAAGTKLKFDAKEVALQGSSAWAYSWDLANEAGPGLLNHPWTVDNNFTAKPGEGSAWEWPSSTAEFKYDTPGSYTAKLSLVNDFGTLSAQRTVNVVKTTPITGAKITVSGALTAGRLVSLTASATLPQFDSVVDYHWDFGDGQGDDQPTSAQDQHVYSVAGSYPVKVTITDALSQKAEATETVTVAAPQKEEPKEQSKTGETPKESSTGNEPPKTVEKAKEQPKTLTKAQQLANALKACKKIKPKRRRASCEKQARKKYRPKATKKKGNKKKR